MSCQCCSIVIGMGVVRQFNEVGKWSGRGCHGRAASSAVIERVSEGMRVAKVRQGRVGCREERK